MLLIRKALLTDLGGISAVFGWLYPAYSTFKVKMNPGANTIDLERWTEYWIVAGGLLGFEILAEWALNWYRRRGLVRVPNPNDLDATRLPFYYELKAIFVIWLAAPATQVRRQPSSLREKD